MSMMIFQLLVFTSAYALVASIGVPPFSDYSDSIKAARKLLEANVLSMKDDIPDLSDPRRHYASIIHVVAQEALSLNSFYPVDYYKGYQKKINSSLAFAVAEPGQVIEKVELGIDDVATYLQDIEEVIQQLKRSGVTDKHLIDEGVNKIIKKNPQKYSRSEEIFLAAGVFAKQLNKDSKDQFSKISENLAAFNFIITGADKLNVIVNALKDLLKLIYLL